MRSAFDLANDLRKHPKRCERVEKAIKRLKNIRVTAITIKEVNIVAIEHVAHLLYIVKTSETFTVSLAFNRDSENRFFSRKFATITSKRFYDGIWYDLDFS